MNKPMLIEATDEWRAEVIKLVKEIEFENRCAVANFRAGEQSFYEDHKRKSRALKDKLLVLLGHDPATAKSFIGTN